MRGVNTKLTEVTYAPTNIFFHVDICEWDTYKFHFKKNHRFFVSVIKTIDAHVELRTISNIEHLSWKYRFF